MKLFGLFAAIGIALCLAFPGGAEAKKKKKKIKLQCTVLSPGKVPLKVKLINGKKPVPKGVPIVVRVSTGTPKVKQWKLAPSNSVISPRDAFTVGLDGKGNDLDGHGGDLAGKKNKCRAWAEVPVP